jgi:sialic acid synthase SpsE
MSVELWAEAGPCDNSVEAALRYAQAVADSGASALKVQWYNADHLVVPHASRYDHTGGDETTQYEMFRKSIYPYTNWDPVIDLCKELGIRFIPSVFDFEGIDIANQYELPILKIASGDLTHHELINAAAAGRQVAISTGAASLPEVADALSNLEGGHILMACHLEYPTPYHRANIARTYVLQDAFPYHVPGFSDHTPGVDTIPLIVATSCQIIEKHFTLEPFKGHDSDFALSPADLRNAWLKIEGTLAVMGDAEVSPDWDEGPALMGARRSPYPIRDIAPGETLEPGDLEVLRPYYGIDPWEVSKYYGRSFEFSIPKHGHLPSL